MRNFSSGKFVYFVFGWTLMSVAFCIRPEFLAGVDQGMGARSNLAEVLPKTPLAKLQTLAPKATLTPPPITKPITLATPAPIPTPPKPPTKTPLTPATTSTRTPAIKNSNLNPNQIPPIRESPKPLTPPTTLAKSEPTDAALIQKTSKGMKLNGTEKG